MIFIDDKWYREFAKEINLSRSKIKEIKEIIKEMASIGLLNTKLYLEDILFSENFFKKHSNYFFRNKRNIEKIQTKIFKNIEFLFNSRAPNELHILEFKDIKKYISELFNINKNELKVEIIDNGEENSNDIENETVKEFALLVNNNQYKKENKIKFNHNTFEYKASFYLTLALIRKDPNNNNLNKQEGARMFNNLLKKYSQEELLRAIKYFNDEVDNKYHNNLIDRIYSYNTFRQNIKGLISLSRNIVMMDYETEGKDKMSFNWSTL